MRGAVGLFAAVLAFLAVSLPSFACSTMSFLRSEIDDPVVVKPDGSFSVNDLRAAYQVSNTGRYEAAFVYGAPPVDIGDGKVGQKITKAMGCSSAEYLLFVDCSNGDAIRIVGLSDDEFVIEGGSSATIRLIQKPRGPIGLRAATTVDELEAIAAANGYKYTRDVMAEVNKMIRPQRYDPFIGCKIFYPDSPGSQK